jgi:hypothetical protein
LSLRQGEREVRSAWLNFDLGVLAHLALRKTADRMLHDNGDETELRPEVLAVDLLRRQESARELLRGHGRAAP